MSYFDYCFQLVDLSK